tara:strand:- start:478 stop:714 length:237 start_codon:yes stop_codon:yes gene_type:complete
MKNTSENKQIDNLSFEESLAELNEIVSMLDNSETSLDESIELYERGLLLKRHCEKKLKNAELKIKKVMENSDAQDDDD